MLLTEHYLEFLNLKGCFTGSSESIHVKTHIVGNHMSRLNYDTTKWQENSSKYSLIWTFASSYFHFQRKRDMSFSPDVSRDWKMASMSPGPEDFGRFRIENNQLKLQVKQLTVDLQSEQGKLTLNAPIATKVVYFSRLLKWQTVLTQGPCGLPLYLIRQ